MPFPILRTPFVVLSEVISLLEPNEIVTASFCSKKVRRLLRKQHQRRKPLEWRLYMIQQECWGQVDIMTSRNDEPVTVLSAKHISEASNESEHNLIQMNEYKRGFSLELPVLYFEDWETGSEMIVDYAADLFNLDVYGLEIDRNGIWAIDWINNRQEKMLRSLELVENDLYDMCGDEELDYILTKDTCASEYYILKETVSDDYRFDGKLGPARHLHIYPKGHWVTLDNLMNFDFIDIQVEGSTLSVPDLHTFLKHWRAGGSHRLVYLKLDFQNDTNFENFERELELVEKANVVDDRVSEEEMADWIDGLTIQRMDGVKATIHLDIRYFVLIVWQSTIFQKIL
ncbi:hypothetical protein B9Z55_015980 [Caenorhabditis nigoni]|uniref:F-box domain-containing protein n=1 Tax=Caenorhabditis nigoni TaxID=1611254 RepID=A0A2G5UDI5_9PELO|nr:hypothetical protein B9Z55_015980 [Caenorhabditis nigoni]